MLNLQAFYVGVQNIKTGAGGGHPGQAGLGAAGGPAVARAGQRS